MGWFSKRVRKTDAEAVRSNRLLTTRSDTGTPSVGGTAGVALPAPVSSRDALGISTVYRAVSIRATAARQLTIDVYRGGVQIDTPAIIKRPSAQAAKDSWKQSRAGTRDIALLSNGIKYSPILLTPEQAQFISSQKLTTLQIARLFGIPASLMLAAVEGDSTSYSNLTQDLIVMTRFSLMEDLSEIEDALTSILPRGQVAKFNLDAVLRADTLGRYQAHKIALDAGFLSIDEVRAIEGLPPVTSSSSSEGVTQ